MKSIPADFVAYKQTPSFTESTIPAGLLKAHKTKPDVWGKIVVLQGQLTYRILEPEPQTYELTPDEPGIVEPGVLHEVEPNGAVAFYVEFYRSPSA